MSSGTKSRGGASSRSSIAHAGGGASVTASASAAATATTASAVPRAAPTSPTTTTSATTSSRTFETAAGFVRFRISRQRLMDSVMDGINWGVEGLVYLIGPLLILLALGIIFLMSYTFFAILLPMMQSKYAAYTTMGPCIIAAHCVWVVFLLVNILFNYYLCVRTRHDGPAYEAIVRQMAEVVGIEYPETPQELEIYRKDFEDRMILRIRRRHARMIEANQNRHACSTNAGTSSSTPPNDTAESTCSVTEEATTTPSSSGITHRRQPQSQQQSSSAPAMNRQSGVPPPQPQVRSWMLLAPYEFGYCGNSHQPKPPRSHYDHVTKQLVLNLDHYCPWMFNSIGYFNYRYFVNFLLYIFVGMLYGALVTLEPFLLLNTVVYHEQFKLVRHAGARIPRLQPMLAYSEEKMFLTLAFMLCLAVGFAVFLLASFHVYLILTAQTTIEFHGNWAQRKRARANGQKWKNPYSVGTYLGNWQRVYGDLEHSKNCTQKYLGIVMAMLPSSRPPQFLPVPIPGHDGRVRQPRQDKKNESDLEKEKLVPETISDAV